MIIFHNLLSQKREFDGWNLHALMELVFRHLPCWGHCRWIRCSHCEQKHQAIKIFWQNLNSRDKSKQVMRAILRKSALIHVVTGGYWVQERDGHPVLVKLAPRLEDALQRDTLLRDLVGRLTSQPKPRIEPLNILVRIINIPFFLAIDRCSFACTDSRRFVHAGTRGVDAKWHSC